MRWNALKITLPSFVVLMVLVALSAKADEKPAGGGAVTLLAVAEVPSPVSPAATGELLHDAVAAPAKTMSARLPRTLTMEVTAYCPCKKCCGKNAHGITASGQRVTANAGLFVAADTALLPFHTKLVIPGYGEGTAVPVLDRGGAIKGNRIDVYFPTHEEALKWGRRMVEVTIVD